MMSAVPYRSLDDLLGLIEGPQGQRMRALYADHRQQYAHARGSSANHQAWTGGYWDHVTELLNIACAQHAWMSAARPLAFTLSDALLILAAHDLEKLVRFDAAGAENPALSAKADKAAFRLELLERYGIELTPVQANALRFAEGVRDEHYTNQRRTMSPLAAFVHVCDLISARMWFNFPAAEADPWAGARRAHPDAATVQLADERYADDGTVI